MPRVKGIDVKTLIEKEDSKLKRMGLRMNEDEAELEELEELDDENVENESEDEDEEIESDSLEIPKPPAEMIDFDEYLKWQKKLKNDHWNRLIIYVNRKHPAIDRTISDPKNKKYIDKLVEPIDSTYFEKMHGGGSYEMYVNEQRKGGSRTLCKVRVKVPMEIDPVLDLSELIVEHHLNRSYVNKLKKLGKLDNNLNVVKPVNEGERHMESMKEMQGQLIDLIKDMREDEREELRNRLKEDKSESSRAMLEMMAAASKASIDMVKEQSQSNQQNPVFMMELMKVMKDIVAENRGSGNGDGNMSMLFQWMMKQSELQNTMLMKLMETKAEPGGGMLDQVEKIISISKLINGGGSEGGWVDKLIDKGSEILPNLLNVVNTAFMMKSGQNVTGGMMNPAQTSLQVNGGTPTMEVDAQKAQIAKDYINQYGGFVVMKLAQGKGGDEFAAELYETFSPAIFEANIRGPIKEIGVEPFVQAVMDNPQMKMQVLNVLGTEAEFGKWCMDFVGWEPEMESEGEAK